MSTGIRSLDRAVHQARQWLNDVQSELGWPDEDRVYSATKAVIKTLRDRLTVEEAHHLSAQLPMLMRGFYFEGYNPTNKPLDIESREEFYQKVREYFGAEPLDAEKATKAVLKTLDSKIGGQMEDIRYNMPKDIQKIFEF